MLELAKILRDIDSFGKEMAEAVSGIQTELETAGQVMHDICDDVDASRNRIEAARTSWLTAGFVEPPDKTYPLPTVPRTCAVIATDGSQIVSDKHEIALCYLLNAASITLYYGCKHKPVSRITPKLCFREEDLFEECNGRRVPMTDTLLSTRRTLAESAQLEYAIQTAERHVPTLALWDGSLIRWSLENEPSDYKKKVLSEYLRAFDLAKSMGIPIAGYISDPGSRDFVNSMKIMLCDQQPIDCDACAYRTSDQIPPCEQVGKLRDSSVFRSRLPEGSRTVLFTSRSKILKEYREHTILAFYLNAGKEIVRVEIPEWVAADPELVNLTHALCYDQAVKGRGYPVALSQAHEHAVIHSPERTAFYDAIERSFIKHGARISRSLKRISKGY